MLFVTSRGKQLVLNTPDLARRIVRAIVILAIILLVTAFQFGPAIAPAPEISAPLVSFAVVPLPVEPVEPQDVAEILPTEVIAQTPAADSLAPTSTPALPEVRSTPEPSDALIPQKTGILRPVAASSSTPLSPDPAIAPTINDDARTARVPILMYHYISDPPPGSDQLRRSLSVTPVNLDAQMNYLRQAGYQTVTLDDLYDHLTQGKPLPGKPIILTFDDGYVDAYTFALPILQKYGFVGTFFILTGPADRYGDGAYLNWAQISMMSEAGMDMELHSREHVDLRNRPNDFLVYQIAGGRDSLAARAGRPVHWFAYPSGLYDDAVVRVLKSAGFRGAVTTAPGRTHTASGLFDLQRVRIFGPGALQVFKQIVEGTP
jgi:peptidoglycan/xylan/chitin deacetylase (PgdA/CDA1 family)